MNPEKCNFCGKEGLSYFECESCQKSCWYCAEHKGWACPCKSEVSSLQKPPVNLSSLFSSLDAPITQTHILLMRRRSINVSNLLEYPQMYLDMDRDGVIDEIPAENIWEWGTGKKGAIIPCNVDKEIKERVLAPIVFTASISCQGKFRIVKERDKKRIRIFDAPDCSGTHILGDTKGESEIIFEIPGKKVVWGIEATRYDETDEDQEIELMFIPIVSGKELEDKAQITKVRVTPWMMLHHLNNPLEIYYSETKTKAEKQELILQRVEMLLFEANEKLSELKKNLEKLGEEIAEKKVRETWQKLINELTQAFQKKPPNMSQIGLLEQQISKIGAPLKEERKLKDAIRETEALIKALIEKLKSAAPNELFVEKLKEFAGGITVTKISAKSQFMQDGMEIGCSYFPNSYSPNYESNLCSYPVTFRAPIELWSEHITFDSVKMPVFTIGDLVTSDHDYKKDLMSCGNLEVTPPSKNFPFGRIYYSDKIRILSKNQWIDIKFDPKVEKFLEIQKLQKPFVLDASWLEVGHVDEVVTFLPKKHEGKLVALMPSPSLAYQILTYIAVMDPDATMEFRAARKLEIENKGAKDAIRYPVAIPLNIWQFLIVGHPALRAAQLLFENIIGGKISQNENLNAINGNFAYFEQNFHSVFESTIKPDPRERQMKLKWLTQIPKPKENCYQNYLDLAKKQLLAAFKDEIIIIDIPVIFHTTEKPGSRAAPLTENMVNMLVFNDKCLFPKPGGPVLTCQQKIGKFTYTAGQDVFEQYMIYILKEFGLTGQAIDDFLFYQSHGGNVHCGTNTRREPDLKGIKWWEFDPSKK